MKHLRLFLIVSIALLALSNVVFAAKPSPAIKSILRDRLIGKYDLSVKGMIKLSWTPDRLNQIRKKYPIEVYKLPNPLIAADYLSYTIYRFRTQPGYLIIREGGLIGAFDVYTTPIK